MDSKLRVGFLLDSFFLPAWEYAALERIVRSGHAELILLILNQSTLKKRSRLSAFWQDRHHWLYHIFNAIDEKLFLREPKALTLVSASEIFSNVPILEVKPIDQSGQQHFSVSDVEQIKSYELDILIKMGFGDLRGDVLSAATHGVWTYRWGDRFKIENGLTSFWEVVNKWPETGVALQNLGVDGQHHKTLFESWLFTYPYSPARSRNYVLWSAASYLPRQIERLRRLGGEKYFHELKSTVEGRPFPLRSNSIPSNIRVLWIMARLAVRNLLEIYRRNFYHEHWELLFDFGADTEKDIYTFRKISPPNDRFWADPHVIYKEPNYYIFVEEYLYQTKRGHISIIEMDRKGNYKQSIPVLQKNYHLSFPFVFDWQGHYYMIPESSENKTIDLYECKRFPDQWELKMTLMNDVKAVDTTMFYSQGKWWLFTAIAEQEAAAPQVELFLFYSDKLYTEQWRSHPMNPIVSDIKKARGAGTIFQRDGRIFRPSQDCSKTYGYGFDINEIILLSETEYCERTVRAVRPDSMKKIIATHTYANWGNLTIVDALTRQPKWVKPA